MSHHQQAPVDGARRTSKHSGRFTVFFLVINVIMAMVPSGFIPNEASMPWFWGQLTCMALFAVAFMIWGYRLLGVRMNRRKLEASPGVGEQLWLADRDLQLENTPVGLDVASERDEISEQRSSTGREW